MYNSVYGGCRGQWIFKNLVPLRKNQIAGYQHATSFVTLGKEGKQNLHLLSVLFYITNIVENNDWEFL